MAQSKKPLAIAFGAALVAGAMTPTVNAEANPFNAEILSGGYDLANYHQHEDGKADHEGKCGEGKCGGEKVEKAMEEGKCGEGKCGGEKLEKAKKAMKEGKCGEGKCGVEKAKDKIQEKAKEGKCGEGKCGGSH